MRDLLGAALWVVLCAVVIFIGVPIAMVEIARFKRRQR